MSTQTISGGDPFRGWARYGTTASYLTRNGNGQTVLTIRPFNGQTFGPVSSTQILSGGDPFRGWD